jgi:KipI family sensor histidine kinase inhibitor
MKFNIASVDSIIIYFGSTICQEVSKKTIDAYKILKNSNLQGVIQIIPSYNSILIHYDICLYEYESICETIKNYLEHNKNDETSNTINKINIPVYYGDDVGIDLERVARLNKLDIAEVIQIHSSVIYKVFAIGFAPGFAYLGEVDKRINTPRLETPRKKVQKGSVAIANAQAAIYPSQSPGGWNILGRTTFKMFDTLKEGLCPVNIGDEIKFYSISKEEFLDTGGVI